MPQQQLILPSAGLNGPFAAGTSGVQRHRATGFDQLERHEKLKAETTRRIGAIEDILCRIVQADGRRSFDGRGPRIYCNLQRW